MYDIEQGYDKDKSQTYFNYPLEEKIKINSIESLLTSNKETYFNIYTDGTCKFFNKKLTIAIGIIIVPYKKRAPISISAKYINVPSTSVAKLVAIAVALSIIPKNSKIDIYVDSQTTISSIEKFINFSKINKKRLLKKTKCSLLLLQIIKEIIFEKNLISFNKIPAHSNNTYNNQADKVAAHDLLKLKGITINTKKLNWPIYTISFHNIASTH